MSLRAGQAGVRQCPHRHHVDAVVGRLAREELPQEDAKGPDVRAFAERAGADDLRGHPGKRPSRGHLGGPRESPRQPKVPGDSSRRLVKEGSPCRPSPLHAGGRQREQQCPSMGLGKVPIQATQHTATHVIFRTFPFNSSPPSGRALSRRMLLDLRSRCTTEMLGHSKCCGETRTAGAHGIGKRHLGLSKRPRLSGEEGGRGTLSHEVTRAVNAKDTPEGGMAGRARPAARGAGHAGCVAH